MRISVITVCKNSESHLERSINSVLEQTYQNRQYILIDGNSKDSTLKIIENYRSHLDTVISEEDTGIYNAMNKALKFANGDIVYFLNSDDFLFDRAVFADIVEEFYKSERSMILYGNVLVDFEGVRKIIRYNRICRKYFYKHTICHQALFIKKILFDIIGGYDENYPIHADTDWLMKAYFRIEAKFKYIDRKICHYSTNGFSANAFQAEKYKFDRQIISAKYFPEAKLKIAIKKLLCKFGNKKYSHLLNYASRE